MAHTFAIAEAAVRIPAHTVYRKFAAETVALNLNTGEYHGLSEVGGHMLELLEETGNVGDAAAVLSVEYGRPLTEIRRDLCQFCSELLERGLIELEL